MFRARIVLTIWLAAVLSASLCRAQDDQPSHIVMLIAEREYQTDESLQAFAKKFLKTYRVSIVLADPNDRHSFIGIEALDTADLLIVSVRRRTLPQDQLDRIREYVRAGKPVIGIRTASHAFSLRGKEPPQGRAVWPEFDAEVFGGHYTNHYGNSLTTTIELPSGGVPSGGVPNGAVPSGAAAPTRDRLLKDVTPTLPQKAGGSLYRVSPLAESASVLLVGHVDGKDPEPVAWTIRRKDGGKSFYTSLGHVDDFRGKVLPNLLRNAIDWSLSP